MFYFYGPGVIPFEGKEIAAGDEFPKGFPEDTIKSLVRKGRAGSERPAVRRPAAPKAPASDEADEKLKAELATANTTITELKNELKGSDNEVADLKKQVEGLEADLAVANTTIDELTENATGGKNKK